MLQTALPAVLANLERHGHLTGVDPLVAAQVLAMVEATIDPATRRGPVPGW